MAMNKIERIDKEIQKTRECKNGQTAGQSDRNCTISRMEFSCRNFFRFLQKAEEA